MCEDNGSEFSSETIRKIVHCDFKPDNFRFDKNGKIYWIDFESIQFFDVEYELAQFTIPEFMLVNDENFFQGLFENIPGPVDDKRLEYYMVFKCVTQNVHCENITAEEKKMLPADEIVESNNRYLEN